MLFYESFVSTLFIEWEVLFQFLLFSEFYLILTKYAAEYWEFLPHETLFSSLSPYAPHQTNLIYFSLLSGFKISLSPAKSNNK